MNQDLKRLGEVLEEAYHLVAKLRNNPPQDSLEAGSTDEVAQLMQSMKARHKRPSELNTREVDFTPDPAGPNLEVVNEQIRKAREQLNRGQFGRNLRKAHGHKR